MVKVKNLENVEPPDLYRLNIISTASIYLVTQLLKIDHKNFLMTDF